MLIVNFLTITCFIFYFNLETDLYSFVIKVNSLKSLFSLFTLFVSVSWVG